MYDVGCTMYTCTGMDKLFDLRKAVHRTSNIVHNK